MTTTTMPWREVFSLPEVEFNTSHGYTRAIESGRIEGAEFQIDKEITDRYQNDRYYDAKKLPSPIQGWVSYDDAKRLLAMGSRYPNEEIRAQQMANLLDDDRIDSRCVGVHPAYDPETEMDSTEARQILGRSTLNNVIQTGEVSKRNVGKTMVLSRSDVMDVAQVLDEWISRPDAARLLGLSDEAIRRWLQRNPDVPTRPCPGLPKKELILRTAVEAKGEGRPVDDVAGTVRVTMYEFGGLTGVPIYRIKRAVAAKQFPAKMVGGSWLIDPYDPEVKSWVESTLDSNLPEGDWISAPEAAALLGISDQSVYTMCRQGQFPSAQKIKGVGGRGSGGKWYIDRSDVNAVLEFGRKGAMMANIQQPRVPVKKSENKAELMPDDFVPQRSVRTNTHPAWDLAKANPNRWVKVDLKEQTVRSEASSRNGKKTDLPGLWTVSKQDKDIFISFSLKETL